MEYRLDVIVPTHGRLEQTIRCMRALYRNTVVPFHLVVMDDSTPDMDDGTDMTPQWFEHFCSLHDNITYVHSDKPYKSYNEMLNEGLKLCETPYVAHAGNSLAVGAGWDFFGLRVMRFNPQIGIIGFKLLDASTGLIESAGIVQGNGSVLVDAGNGGPNHKHSETYECMAVAFALVLMRREAALGSLVENLYHGFKGMEDLDACFVMREKGWKVFYCGLGKGYHNICATRGSSNILPQIQNLENKGVFAKRWGYKVNTCQ